MTPTTKNKLKEVGMKKVLDGILRELEVLRMRKQDSCELPDYIIRVCETIVAEKAGYKNRIDWKHLQTKGGVKCPQDIQV